MAKPKCLHQHIPIIFVELLTGKCKLKKKSKQTKLPPQGQIYIYRVSNLSKFQQEGTSGQLLRNGSSFFCLDSFFGEESTSKQRSVFVHLQKEHIECVCMCKHCGVCNQLSDSFVTFDCSLLSVRSLFHSRILR